MLLRLRQALSTLLSRSRGRTGEAGYNMVMLIVALTVLNIMVAAMMPLMSTEIQREKEEELIFRGFQYAEAIRVFRLRFQHFPNKLDELIEVKPRCIRQLWKDPMTKDGKWGLIFQGQGVPLHPQNPQDPEGQQSQPVNPQNPEGQPNDGRNDNGLNTPKQGDEVAIGPIVGVYSKSPKESHLVFYGHQRYDEWRFTFDLIPNGGQRRPVAPGIGDPGQGGLLTSFSTRWLGRPMYLVDQQFQPQNGTLPGQQPGNGPQTQPGGGKKPTTNR